MKTYTEKSNRFFTASQVAEMLGISRVAVHKKIKKGEIKAEKVGKIYIIPSSYVKEVTGRKLSSQRKKIIEIAVRRVVKQYSEVLIRLGRE